jgi:hypothetical protein
MKIPSLLKLPSTDTNASDSSQVHSLSLKMALVIAVFISLIFVSLSYWMYLKSPNYKYDLARPDVKKVIKVDTPISDESSPVDSAAVKKVDELINNQLNDLKGVDGFSQKALSDRTLFNK